MSRATARVPVLVLALLIAATVSVRADKTDDYVKAQMDAFRVPGLSLAVIRNGTVIKVAGYGFADVEGKAPAAPETIYKIGSVSKQFLATAIVLLAGEGKLALDDSVAKVLNDAPSAWKPMTIRHLLTHTGGLVRESPGFDPLKIQRDADLIKAAHSLPLRFAPGEKWEYSNLGYFMVAEIIGKVTGRPWTEYMTAKVFKPAGMGSTRATNDRTGLPPVATGYTGNDNAGKADDWPALRPSGAFLSTVLDLAKWDAVLYGNGVLSDAARKEMWTPVQLRGGTTAPYGFGWHVDSGQRGRRVWHGGGLPGFISHYVRFVDHGLTVIVLANGDDVDLPSIANGVAALYLQ